MLISATSRSSGPQTAGPTPHERGRRAFSYGAGPVGWGPELREVALILVTLFPECSARRGEIVSGINGSQKVDLRVSAKIAPTVAPTETAFSIAPTNRTQNRARSFNQQIKSAYVPTIIPTPYFGQNKAGMKFKDSNIMWPVSANRTSDS